MSFDDFSGAGREGRRLFCDETSGCVQQQPLGRPPGDVAMRRRRRSPEISLYLAWAISASICWAFARPWPVVPRCVADLFGYTSARGNQGERRKGKAQTPRALQGKKRGTSRAPGLEQVHRKGKREWIFRPRRGGIIRKRPQEERPIPPAPLAPEQILSAVGMASGSEEQQQQREDGDQAPQRQQPVVPVREPAIKPGSQGKSAACWTAGGLSALVGMGVVLAAQPAALALAGDALYVALVGLGLWQAVHSGQGKRRDGDGADSRRQRQEQGQEGASSGSGRGWGDTKGKVRGSGRGEATGRRRRRRGTRRPLGTRCSTNCSDSSDQESGSGSGNGARSRRRRRRRQRRKGREPQAAMASNSTGMKDGGAGDGGSDTAQPATPPVLAVLRC